MANRKRNIQMKFYVTEEEKRLIDEKMAQLPTRRYGAYLRKMAIDGYIIYTDTTEIKAFTSELSVIGRNINQIAKRLNAGDPVYQADMEEIRSIFSCHVEDGVPTDFCTASITSDLHFKSFSLFYDSIHQSFEPGIHDNDKLACSWQFLQHFVKSFLFHIFLHIHPTGNATGF